MAMMKHVRWVLTFLQSRLEDDDVIHGDGSAIGQPRRIYWSNRCCSGPFLSRSSGQARWALESISGDPTAPGQAASPDDVIEATLRREIWEELGIEIKAIRLLRVDAIPYIEEEPGPYRLDFYYRCAPVQGFATLREELASGKVKPVSPEIKQMRLVALTDLAGYDLFSSDVRFLHDDLPRKINLGFAPAQDS